MSQNNVVVNSAHPPGKTCLAFSRDGHHAFTGGSDTLVRIWRTDQGPDQEPDVAPDALDAITSISPSNDYWLSGSADSEVRRYIKGKPELDGLVTSASGVAVWCVAVNPQGKRVAVTSEEHAVKLIDLQDTVQIEILSGHTKGVRRVTWHPSGSLLTTSGADGKIIVWDVSEDTAKVEKTIEGIIPAVADTESPEFAHDCSAVWHTSGQYFIAASRAHEIVSISRSTWSKTATFADDSVSGATTALALSANGVYLASASTTGVAIWSTQTRRLLFQHPATPGATVLQLAWSPSKNLLAWTDTEGVLTRWTDPIPSSSPDPVRISASSVVNGAQGRRHVEMDLFGAGPVVNGKEDREVGGVNLDLDNEDWIIDDIGGGMDDEPKAETRGDEFVKEMVSITKAQPPFQPGSTPMENKKGYLAYNMIGVIEVTDQDTHHIVNVEFHDRSLRKSYHFTDHFKYSFASLGERGALFACQPEQEHPAQVLYKPYGTWATQADWTYPLHAGQRVLGVTAGGLPGDAGDGHVVVATDEGDLTFLGGGGTERRVLGLEGEFVSMVAGAEWVFVVCRAGATTIDGSQNLMGTVIAFNDFTVLQRGMLPIPKGHTLRWIGVTEEGAPAIYDSTGYLHVLAKHRVPLRGTWARVLDTGRLERRQGKDESYWPVGVSGETFNCLILKGRQEHPGFPRPLIQELPMRMPFRRTEGKEAVFEEHFHRDTLFLDIARPKLNASATAQRELALDKELIQLVQAACKADRLARALEVTRLLHRPTSIDMAVRVAQFYHLAGLQERMEALKREREEAEEEESEREDEERTKRVRATGVWEEQRPKPFGDFGPPPRVDRPAWRTGAPIGVEGTRFSSKAPAVPPVSPPEGKRKREESVSWDPEEGSSTAKRRAVDESSVVDSPSVSAAPKPKANPFARKAGQEPNGARNPFARKAGEAGANKMIQKSESFFDKVDVAESGGPKSKRPNNGKGKEKKELGRQTTLFGMMPKDKGKGKSTSKATEDTADTGSHMIEVQYTADAGSQMTEMQDTADADSHMTETQTDVGPSQEEETQIEGAAVGSGIQDPLQAESPEPIEWPSSPGAEGTLVDES